MTFTIGERVYVYEHDFEGKVIGKFKEEGSLIHYHVREFEHPHRMVWVDEYHVDVPRGKRHDDAYVSRNCRKCYRQQADGRDMLCGECRKAEKL